METFRHNFITKCAELGIDPPSVILDQIKPQVSEKGIPKHPEKLDLSGHPLHIKTITALCFALQNDVIFTTLVFSDAFLGDDGAILLAGALKTNTTLRVLDMRGNNIRSDGATALSQMLKVNSSLERLLLEWNCIGIWETGAKALGDALPVNQHLEHLDLRNCKIGQQSAVCIAQGLRHNTTLKTLDIRWNNAGIIGGRAFVEALKWNMVVTEIELVGNDIPDDVMRSISIALERNRDKQKHIHQNRAHSEHLSATLQALTSAHQANLDSLSTRLYATDGRAQSLSEKLGIATKELAEANTYRKNADDHIKALEMELAKEKREGSQRISELQNELFKEKEKRLKVEDQIASSHSTMSGKLLELEANLHETEMKAEVLRRDKSILLEEMDKYKEREKAINELHKEKIAKIEANHSHKMLSLSDSKDSELQEHTKRFEEKLRHAQVEKQKLEEEFDAFKIKVNNEKRDLMEKVSQTEVRVKKEEESRRKELEAQLEAMRQSRDQVQADLSSHMTSKNAMMRDHDAEIKRLTDQKVHLNEQVGNLRSEIAQGQSELANLRKQADDALRQARSVNDKFAEAQREMLARSEEIAKLKGDLKSAEDKTLHVVSQKDALIAKLKDKLKRIESELEEEHENQSLRMKDLALQINGLLAERQRRMRTRGNSSAADIVSHTILRAVKLAPIITSPAIEALISETAQRVPAVLGPVPLSGIIAPPAPCTSGAGLEASADFLPISTFTPCGNANAVTSSVAFFIEWASPNGDDGCRRLKERDCRGRDEDDDLGKVHLDRNEAFEFV
ncbi:Leucine-rich repeat-containing protein 45 [Phlyctochytrium planicorne]|nr:Leucine-rich repeat-containing protein 45 [Phlyctochytrium planicorne]